MKTIAFFGCCIIALYCSYNAINGNPFAILGEQFLPRSDRATAAWTISAFGSAFLAYALQR